MISLIEKNREKYSLHPHISQKSDFQPLTTKRNNIGHSTVKTMQIWTLGGFQGGFTFCEN